MKRGMLTVNFGGWRISTAPTLHRYLVLGTSGRKSVQSSFSWVPYALQVLNTQRKLGRRV
jgi:hypothetical protein